MVELADLNQANRLADELERLERDLAAYQKADSVRVHLWFVSNRENYPSNQYDFPADEIRDAVLAAIARRIGAKRAQLAALGVRVPEPTIPAANSGGRA